MTLESLAPLLPLVLALVVSYWLFRRVHPRQPIPPPGPARREHLLGTAFFGAGLAAAVAAFVLYALKDLLRERTGLNPGPLDYAILVFVSALSVLRAKQHRSRTRSLLANVALAEPHVLYLRAFSSDTRALSYALELAGRLSPFARTPEEQLAASVRPIGALVEIGDPGNPLPTPGGLTLYEDEANWKAAVTTMLQNSAAVILKAAPSPGVQWELAQCRLLLDPQRFIVLLLPLRKRDQEQFRVLFSSAIGKPLPPLSRSAARAGLIYFDSDWVPTLTELRAPFWRRPIGGAILQAALTYSLRPLYEACKVTWKPPPFALAKLFLIILLIYLILAPFAYSEHGGLRGPNIAVNSDAQTAGFASCVAPRYL